MKFTKMLNPIGNMMLVLLLLLLLAMKGPTLLNYQVYYILSDSMAPEINPGALIYVKEAKLDEVIPGDCITFRLGTDTRLPATHRAVSVDLEKREIVTKGDANPAEDIMKVKETHLIGKVVWNIPLVGYGAYFLQTGAGRIWCILTFIFVLLDKKSLKD